ncbi:MAG: hypothetical protein WAW86_10925 [Gammaproteobacteria bacterium]
MKQNIRSTLGVTLLEIMLVLAIAAMIIVMSIRYYQSATSSQQVNTILQQIQGVTAAMDNLAVGSGTYAGITQAQLQAAVGGAANLTTPLGTTITMSAPSATGYTITAPLNATVCPMVATKVAANLKMAVTAPTTCTTLTYTYNAAT